MLEKNTFSVLRDWIIERRETTFIFENQNQPNMLQATRCTGAFSAGRFPENTM